MKQCRLPEFSELILHSYIQEYKKPVKRPEPVFMPPVTIDEHSKPKSGQYPDSLMLEIIYTVSRSNKPLFNPCCSTISSAVYSKQPLIPNDQNIQCICSAQSKNRYNSGIVLGKVGILTLSANSGIVPDNSRIAQGVSLVYRLGVRPCAKWEWLDKVRMGKVGSVGQSENGTRC